MLSDRLENQKGIRKKVTDLLFKKGYCICIPDAELIQSYLRQLHPRWIQKFFLSKNELQLGVIPMFMLIFVRNKCLTVDQSQRLLELLHVLLMQTDENSIDQLFFDNKIKKLAWSYFFLNELIKFTLADFVKSEANNQRIIAMATTLEFFLDRASPLIMTKFCLDTENSGFNIVQKLLYVIAYENLHPNQIDYLSCISQKIINKLTDYDLETLCFQTHRDGYSFIWYTLGTWLQLVFENKNIDRIKINRYSKLINSLFEKIDNKKISSIVLENEYKGSLIILRYFFFKNLQLDIFHYDLVEIFQDFNLWSRKIFSALTFSQIELILKKLPSLLNNDLTLSISDKHQLFCIFFEYIFDYCNLKTREVDIVKNLKKQLEEQYLTGNRLMKFFRQLRRHSHFFNSRNSCYSINEMDEISCDETCDLLSPECARLNANYLTLSI